MFKRQTSGSCACIFCKQLISVKTPTCPHCHRQNPSLWGYSQSIRRLGDDFGFTKVVIWGCIVLYLATLTIDFKSANSEESREILSPSIQSLFVFGAGGALPVFELGRWWTILSAGWLHGSLLHIAFNLVWVRSLSLQVAKAFGSGRLVVIYTVSIVAGGVLSALAGKFLGGARLAVGASGGVFGLLGALITHKQITKSFTDERQAWILAFLMFILGAITPNVDNWGHLGGFLGGYIISGVKGIYPRQPECMQQLFLAIACLVLTLLSVLASIIHAYFMSFFNL